jgi:type VI secretion system protein
MPMSLTLTVVRYQSTRPERDITVTVEQGGCVLGRSAKSDLVLPDPSRTISSTHARIDFQGGRYVLTDESTNGTTVNRAAAPVGKGNSAPLSDGDTLNIGAYEIAVAIRQDAGPAAPLGPLEGMEEETPDPLDLIGTPGAPGRARQGGGAGLGGGGLLPDDDWGAPAGGGLIPDDFDLGADTGLSQRSAAEDAFTPPAPIPSDFGRDATDPDLGRAAPPPAREAPPPRAAPPAAPAGTAEAAVRAFFEALGLMPDEVPPEAWGMVMERSGGVLREAVAGLARVLAARTAFKRELRLDVTIIQPAENNPLKFSVDADDALRYLIVREARGFLPPVQAVQDGYMDVQAHQLALMSALRAALQSLVGRFNPARLEAGFHNQTRLDQLVPMARKAKCWDVFTETFGEIAKDAEDGFMDLLDHAFAEAYEKQVRELKDPRRPH